MLPVVVDKDLCSSCMHCLSADNLLPHWKGARHPNETAGMLVDPSPNRLATLDEAKIQCSPTKGPGIEGEGGYKLLQKVKAKNSNNAHT